MIYIFQRIGGYFYPIELPNDQSALDCIPLNPGTVMVWNSITKEVLWTDEE